MNLSHTPATPLPWKPSLNDGSEQDAAYLTHAANAYPKLVEMMRSARMELVGRSNMGLLVKHFEDLLRELGEEA